MVANPRAVHHPISDAFVVIANGSEAIHASITGEWIALLRS